MAKQMNNQNVMENTKELAAFLADTQFEDLPSDVIEKAKLIIADTIGVGLVGSTEPEMKEFYDRLPEGEEAVLFKEGFPRTNSSMAGVANAIATCLVQLDEGTPPVGHPALHVLPPALAMAQYHGKSGSEFLTAFILGYEVHYRLQKAAKFRKPVNPHGNTGHVGATVAIGKLMGWDAEQMLQGMNCAAALPLGTSFEPSLSGDRIASAFPSLSTPISFLVKDLVESGFKGYDLALSDSFGHVLGEEFDSSILTKGLGVEYAVMKNYFKFHTACFVLHPVLDALADAIGYRIDHNQYPPIQLDDVLRSTDIREINIRGTERTLRLMYPSKNNPSSGLFSLPYTAAVFVLTGKVVSNSFSENVLTDPQIRHVESLVKLELDPNLQEVNDNNPDAIPAEVRIVLADGKILEGRCMNPYGTSKNPPQKVDIYEKFKALTSNVLEDQTRKKVWDTVLSVETLTNMNDLFVIEYVK